MPSPPPPPPSPRAPPPGVPRPGDVIGAKYRVERVLGAGGMGVVLAARHLELDEMVAIKMLLPHLPASGDAAARFLREAKAAIRIRDEHVVRVLDVARLPSGSPYIVMEYLEGTDLGQLVERSGALEVDDAVTYVLQACEAIAAAHALGIIHRDLKPANLFLTHASDGAPCIKVLDFGISKVASPEGGAPGLTSTETVMGTPCFMSPEQLRSTRDVDGRTDIWSMGAILHALLTGAPPYDGESNADVSAKIIRDSPTPLRTLRPDASEALEATVLRCLQKDPALRLPDVASLADALAAIVAHDGAKATAARVTRIASGVAATAATVRASSDARVSPSPGSAPPAAEPTRTASAWGDAHHEAHGGKRTRLYVAAITAVAAVAGATAFGAARWHSASRRPPRPPLHRSLPAPWRRGPRRSRRPPCPRLRLRRRARRPSRPARRSPALGPSPRRMGDPHAPRPRRRHPPPRLPPARPRATAPAPTATTPPAPTPSSTHGLFDGRE